MDIGSPKGKWKLTNVADVADKGRLCVDYIKPIAYDWWAEAHKDDPKFASSGSISNKCGILMHVNFINAKKHGYKSS